MFERNSNLLNRKFKEYLIPTILSSMSMMLGVIVDGIIVGNTIGANAMAAVNVAQPLMFLFQTLFFLFGMGGAALVSISKGARDEQKAHKAYTLGGAVMLALSFLVMLIGLIFLERFINLICSEQSLFVLTRDYVRVLLMGTPLLLFVPGMVFFVRVDGQPRLSAAIFLVANIVNLVMDLVYILVFDMGIAGAALATITGYAAGFILLVKYWLSKQRSLKLARISLSDASLLGEICGTGLAGAVNTLLLTVKTLCINRIVQAAGGADGMAVFAVCMFAVAFVSMFISGASDTMVPLLGMLYGEKDFRGMRFVLRRAFTVVIACTIVSILLMEFFPARILALFDIASPERLAIGISALRIFAFSLLAVGFSCTMMYYLQTTGHKALSVTISFLRGFVLIIPSAAIFSALLGIEGVWWAYIAAEGLTVIITLLLSRITALRSSGRCKGLFLMEAPAMHESVYNGTIHGNAEDAAALAKGLIDFCHEQGLGKTAMLVGLAAEEAAMSITAFNENAKPLEMDVLCRINQHDVILSLRDDGKAFDAMRAPLEKNDDGEIKLDNITVLKRIAKKVDYVRNLGLNNTVILLEKKDNL
jgi:putative MATE family efflux protein